MGSLECGWLEINSSCRDGEGVGGGFGCVNVNGNSTDKSLHENHFQKRPKMQKTKIVFFLPSHGNDDFNFHFILHDYSEILFLCCTSNSKKIKDKSNRIIR